jgi:hypothetical protein
MKKIMVEFERSLKQVNVQNFSYVRPMSSVTEDEWVRFKPNWANAFWINFTCW